MVGASLALSAGSRASCAGSLAFKNEKQCQSFRRPVAHSPTEGPSHPRTRATAHSPRHLCSQRHVLDFVRPTYGQENALIASKPTELRQHSCTHVSCMCLAQLHLASEANVRGCQARYLEHPASTVAHMSQTCLAQPHLDL